MDYRLVVLLSIVSMLLLISVKSIRTFLYSIFGINTILNEDVTRFKSRLQYHYLKTMCYSLFYGYLFIIFSMVYQFILLGNGSLSTIALVFVLFPVFHRIVMYVGIKLYLKGWIKEKQKVTLYKNISLIYSLLITFLVIEIPLFILTVKVDMLPITFSLVINTLAWIVAVYGFRQNLFRKVTISDLRFTTTYRDFVFEDFRWEDISSITESHENRMQSLRIVYQSDKVLLINVSRQKLRTILQLCPNEELREQMIKIGLVL